MVYSYVLVCVGVGSVYELVYYSCGVEEIGSTAGCFGA